MKSQDEFLAYLLKRLDLADKAGESALEALPGSHSYSALTLTAGESRYMVRRGGRPDGVRDLEREFKVLTLLDGSGLAPSPMMYDADRKFIVYQYLPGTVWDRNMLVESGTLEALVESLARLHSYQLPGTVCDPLKTVEFYLQNAEPALRSLLMERVSAAMAGLHARQPVLCHYDMWCGNIIQGTSTGFIDWEFANGGPALIDLATLVCYHELDEDETETLWRSYAARVGGQLHRKDLAICCTIVDCLTVAWSCYLHARDEGSGTTEPFYGPAMKRLGLDIGI